MLTLYIADAERGVGMNDMISKQAKISEEKMQIIINNYFKSECNVDTSIRQAFEKGFRIGVKKGLTVQPEPQWIPCSERLPEEEYVLISKKPTKISGDKWCVSIAIRMADPRSRKVNWRDIGFGVIQDDNVLAWMPLPEPWEGEQDE